jgi:hypothetical protein
MSAEATVQEDADMRPRNLFAIAIQSWRCVEYLHTTIFILGLPHDALTHESVTFLESSAGQTALLLAVLVLLAFLHLRLTKMNHQRPVRRDRGEFGANGIQPTRPPRTPAPKAKRRSTRSTGTEAPLRRR